MQLVLGLVSTGYILKYVYIFVYSNTYEEYVKHLDAMLAKLTTAAFTINIDKCNFISKISNVTVEVCDSNGKIKVQFNLKLMKVYKK